MSQKKCPDCGQPMLRKGQKRKQEDDYRHAQGCPLEDDPDYAAKVKKMLEEIDKEG